MNDEFLNMPRLIKDAGINRSPQDLAKILLNKNPLLHINSPETKIGMRMALEYALNLVESLPDDESYTFKLTIQSRRDE